MPCRPLILLLAIVLTVMHSNAQGGTPTFQATTHIVLVDVSVTDKSGNPVHSLPESAFHVFDNGKAQLITSFEEHNGAAETSATGYTPGVSSNEYLLHPPAALNVILIDLARLAVGDQMYLQQQLDGVFGGMSGQQMLAVYLRSGAGCFLLQNFTSDRKLLLDAVHIALPRFPRTADDKDLSDEYMLRKVAESLNLLPGRKNVLWLSGGSARILSPKLGRRLETTDFRALYDDLNVQRIALYPIDARGLEVALKSDFQRLLWEQHMDMKDAAEATGGEAFYNTNGIAELTQHILNTDRSFYTLTYTPQGLQLDNKWHRVRVSTDNASYRLSFRTGYFADGSVRDKEKPPQFRTRLLANAQTLDVLDRDKDQPLIFAARIISPAAPHGSAFAKATAVLSPLPARPGTIAYTVRLTVPMKSLVTTNVGRFQVVMGVSSIALDRDGHAVGGNAENVSLALDKNVLSRNPNAPIVLDQPLFVSKRGILLDIGVWDATSGRSGTVQVRLDATSGSHAEQ